MKYFSKLTTISKFATIVILTSFVYFFSWAFVYYTGVNKLAIQSEDTVPALFLPISIIKNQNLFLDEFYSQMLQKYPNPDDKTYALGILPFYLRKAGEHYVSAFTIITPLLALPFYLGAYLMGFKFTWDMLIVLSHLASAFVVALSGGFLYLLLKKKLSLSEEKSLLLTGVYCFATINYALLSQSLWQHGSLELFTILSLYFYTNWQKTPKNLIWFSFFAGLAILSRPTAALFFVTFSLVALLTKPKNLGYLILGMLPCILFFAWYNGVFYQSIANQGYSNQLFRNWLGDFPFSFFGVWLSPSKGLLVYSPVFIFCLFGAYIVYKNIKSTKSWKDPRNTFFILSFSVIVLHTLIISFWKHWFGGWSFGYRMSSDVIPFFILLLVPFVESAYFARYKKFFIACVIFSVLVELFGMVFFDGIWHAAYDRGFKDTSWLWSLKDSEFVFNIRRVFVKLGVLAKACPVCE